jgi:GxxExxY protein
MNGTGSLKELEENRITEAIIGAAIEVHRETGPGLLEGFYEICLAREFELRGIPFERQYPLTVHYKGIDVRSNTHRLDFWVERQVIVELKAVTEMLPIFEQQIYTYLKITGCHVGLLINFNVRRLTQGVKRIILD